MSAVLGLIERFILLDLLLIGGAAAASAASSCVIMGAASSFWTDEIVSKLQLVRCYRFFYFVCDVDVLETRSVNCRLLLD